jgi:hypothetical protein
MGANTFFIWSMTLMGALGVGANIGHWTAVWRG